MNARLPISHLYERTREERWRIYLQRHFCWVVVLILATLVAVVYMPALTAYFISDDFQYVSYLFFHVKGVLNGPLLEFWFIQGMDGGLFFRPFGHALFLADYLIWNLNPIGYHLTNLILHLFASFEVFLLALLLSKRRGTGVVAAIFFAILPVHAEAVSWAAARYDVLAGLFYLGSIIFYVLYRRKSQQRFYLASLASFALGLASKETAFTLPALLLCYEALSWKGWRELPALVARQSPFWLVLAARVAYFGHGYQGLQLATGGWQYWMNMNLVRVLDPLPSNPSTRAGLLVVVLVTFVLASLRRSRQVAFCLMWIPVTALATLTSGPSDRSFYIPSVGLCLMVAILWAWMRSFRQKPILILASVGVILLVVGYSATLFTRNQVYHRAGEIAQDIPAQVIAMHPTFPANSRLIFTGVPDRTPEGVLVFLTGFPGMLNSAYPPDNFSTFRFSKFPIWLDNLERTFLFQVEHRNVTERTDLVRALQARSECSGFSIPVVEWNFSADAQGWEAWNELAAFHVQDAELATRSEGNDPYMVSPRLDIPSIAFGDVVITLRARSDTPRMNGAVYWQATDQGDFSPGLKVPFSIVADGEEHTYHADIGNSGMLLMGDHILRLRLDPADAPAEIELKSVQVTSHCTGLDDNHCSCGE